MCPSSSVAQGSSFTLLETLSGRTAAKLSTQSLRQKVGTGCQERQSNRLGLAGIHTLRRLFLHNLVL